MHASHAAAEHPTAPGESEEVLVRLAEELAQSARTRIPAPLLSRRFPKLTLTDAYRIQQISMGRRLRAGARIVGHKVGLTSAAMQEQMGIHEPDSGVVLDHMVAASGSSLHASDFMNPRIETEIAFRLGRDLPGPASLEAVRAAVAEVFLAFEILDTCFTGWDIALIDSVADNAACAGVIIGRPVPFDPAWDLAAEQITARADGTLAGAGQGRDILGDPLQALVWLTRRLSGLGGRLRAGDIVLAGSVHASVPLTPGTHFRATGTRLPGIHLRVLPADFGSERSC
ncbi:2-keto-4-pentenoate hydratase [Streptomyces sp. NEAU-Y11]|uniref:2-keto-4-pentenoate hydratase n=1 Tax=Streptomyces cucumeris TaxID=2962890 RepID=UPI0020C8A78E|nr:fumarylacetoacetate hydrolase family protein [Streptomyces sp. NEAU-Y11]MCP9211453.1 fumarylacetoacetate hydrolase family protein [Streptomyces sp. NEAU-Y11]